MNEYAQALTSTGHISIDKITFICPAPADEQKPVQKRLSTMTSNAEIIQTKSPEHRSKDKGSSDIYKQRYKVNIVNADSSHGELVIEANPKRNARGKPRGFLRFEYNPNKCDSLLVARVMQRILGKKMYRRFYTKCWVTRLDIAVDVPGITPEDIHIYIPGVKVSTLKRGKDGCVETIYTGSKKSRLLYSVYDKVRQLKATLGVIHAGYLTRFEVIVRNKGKKIRLSDLPNMPNVFDSIHVYDSYIDESIFPADFIEALKADGLQAARMAFTQRQRDKIFKKLERYRIYPIDPDRLWEDFPAALSFLEAFRAKTE